ncbi:MAG TPA: RNA polymerase factor sigma-54 [Opitutales bacterium]|nr:RNA polymerase factor sigma-54 [Opitutales bacterium]
MPSQGFQQVQKQTQSLVLAPQLRQSLKILQVSALELRDVVLEELQTNPTLEELPMDGMSLDAQTRDKSPNEPPTPDAVPEHEKEMELGSRDFEMYNQMHEDYRESMAEDNGNYSYSTEDEERRKHFFDSITSETSLQEELARQAELTDATPAVLKAFDYVVGSLDDNGFLSTPLPDLALSAGLPLADVQEASRLLKTLDPAGIGATSLRECLLLQLEAAGKKSSVAHQIIKDYYELLLRRRIPELARRVGVTPDAVTEALEEIATLDPAPGRKFSADSNRVVVPDVTVYKDEMGEWVIVLNNDYIPRLRLAPAYKDLLAKGTLAKKDKDYIQDKFRSGKFIISSIEQRQQTIERITREILKFQHDFFEEGASRLRPLTMSQVADVVGVHETTVSRAIANKYIQTPHGLFDMKYFFTPGYKGEDGSSVSNTSVKERIAKIIEAENSAKPLSDQQIVTILGDEGITIARRTVAKYREELGILPTNLRRQY